MFGKITLAYAGISHYNSMCDKGGPDSVDTNEMKECIMALAGEIGAILGKAGSPKTWNRDYGVDVADVISHLGYINSVVNEWGNP